MATFFTEFFHVNSNDLDEYGAFNVSIINDLPLFIDPFLLFNSEKQEYRLLHDQIIKYLVFLKEKAADGEAGNDLLKLWYCFPEVKQNWLGFSLSGNSGTGLGLDFGKALHTNLYKIFSDFGKERITVSSHLEKVCLIQRGIGRDNISDFTTNLIIDYLCKYTEKFAQKFISKDQTKKVFVNKTTFNYETESWERSSYDLPWINGDYVILTPKDILTKDENWINRSDLIHSFEQIPFAMPDEQLRAQVSNYFSKALTHPKNRYPNKKEKEDAAAATILHFPQLIDYYIKIKEQSGDQASNISSEKVLATEKVLQALQELQRLLENDTNFYKTGQTTYEESHERLAYLKDVIEHKGGYKIFYTDGKPLGSEKDLQIVFRLVWFGTPSDVGTEVNDGRGPVDFKISRGARDKTLIEMKLARNTALERNLQNQLPIYQAASDTKKGIKAILYFTKAELERAEGILDKLKILGHKDIVLIDARSDNKPSGSKA